MAAYCPNEGETLVANLVFKNADVDRGTSLQLGLFNTSAAGETDTEATVSSTKETIGTGYSRITLTDASWTVTNDTASYAEQTFTAGGTWTNVYGYFIATTGTTARLLVIEDHPSGPHTLSNGDSYKVTPSVTIA